MSHSFENWVKMQGYLECWTVPGDTTFLGILHPHLPLPLTFGMASLSYKDTSLAGLEADP